jgi:predicted nuclease of predicted toxin-antitoxin system
VSAHSILARATSKARVRLARASRKHLNSGQPNLKQDGATELKLLLDEMYAGLKEYFETLGWEVQTAQDIGLKGASDRDIVEYARSHDLLLVTQDQKPADLAEMVGVKCVLVSNAMIAKIADEKIRQEYLNKS